MNLSDFAQEPAAPRNIDPQEVCYADMVPSGLRMTLREEMKSYQDESFANKPFAERPPVQADYKEGQTVMVFHPQAMKVRTQMQNAPPVAASQRQQAKREARLQNIDHQVDVMTQIQQGAHDVSSTEAEGAAVLRQRNLEKRRGFLKRKFTDDAGVSTFDTIRRSQTTMDEARSANARLDQENRAKRRLLEAQTEYFVSLWPQELREALENNVFCPTAPMVYLGEADVSHLKDQYIRIRELIKEDANPFGFSRFFEEVPKVPLDDVQVEGDEPMQGDGADTTALGVEFAAGARLAQELPEHSFERKLAILDSIMVIHQGELRMWGGKWNLTDEQIQEEVDEGLRPWLACSGPRDLRARAGIGIAWSTPGIFLH